MKKIIVASDSFKGCLSSKEVSEAVKLGVKHVYPNCKVISIPVADGGEGMLDALMQNTDGKYIGVKAHDPLMNRVDCCYGISGDGRTAFIEMAVASGLTLVPPEKRNPLLTTTFGTGELIRDAIAQGCKTIILGIGGSATNDAGVGMLQALGFKFRDQDGFILGYGGEILSKISSVDISGVDPTLSGVEFIVACDVANPFCGTEGAAHVFAKQKGATEEIIIRLDEAMKSFARIIYDVTGIDVTNSPGAGAAGGVGGALLAFLNAELKQGIDLILDFVNFKKKLVDADLVITGEGRMDSQTGMGKVPFGILNVVSPDNIPVIALTGELKDVEELNEMGFQGIFPIAPGPISLEESIQPSFAKKNISRTVSQLLKVIQSFSQNKTL